MNAYDWDKTVFRKDTTASFFLHCFWRYPAVRRYAWKSIPIALRHLRGKRPLPQQKQAWYRYLACVPNIEAEVQAFWAKNEHLVGKPAMPCEPKPGDLIISASGEFLLRDVCERRGYVLIGTHIDPATGDLDGIDCYGEEKVRRFREAYGEDARVEEWYSDSTSDAPMAALADRAYIVRPKGLKAWPE